jgi:hypothetical protein
VLCATRKKNRQSAQPFGCCSGNCRLAYIIQLSQQGRTALQVAAAHHSHTLSEVIRKIIVFVASSLASSLAVFVFFLIVVPRDGIILGTTFLSIADLVVVVTSSIDDRPIGLTVFLVIAGYVKERAQTSGRFQIRNLEEGRIVFLSLH